MASPFEKFRKNQKQLLVFVGVVCMVAFVFGGVTCGPTGGPVRGENEAVFETESGTFRESDLDSLRRSRQVANRFVGSIRPGASFGSTEDEALANLMLLSEKAQRLGLVVSDQAVNDFIRAMHGNQLTTQDVRGIMQSQDLTPVIVFDAVRRELLAANLLQMLFPRDFMQGASPGERWDYYSRIHRRVHAQVLPVPVEAFVDQVATPDEEELREFFEKYKDVLPDPDSPEPGFRRPRKATFEYILADFDDFYQAALDDVTAAEIEEYYRENQENFPYSGLDEEPEEDAPLEAPPEEGPKEEVAPVAPESDPLQPAGEAPDGAGFSVRGHKTIPVAFQEEEEDAGDAPGDEPAPRDDRPQEPAELDGGDEAAPEAGADEAPLRGTLQSILSEYAIPEDITAGPNPQYDPLWKVEDDIRKTLARTVAAERIEETLRPIEERMRRFYKNYTTWQVLRDGEKPERPNLQELAGQEPGLEFHQTPSLLTARQLAETAPEFAQATIGDSGLPVRQYGYSDSLAQYDPVMASDDDRNRYLFLRTEQQHMTPGEAIPESLDAVREEVLRAWKMIQARELALAKAKELAEEARSGNQPLTELTFAGETGREVEPFTWLEEGSLFSQALSINDIEGIDRAGEDFMRTVAALEPGEVGVAMNRPETTAYVVRVTDVDYISAGREQSPTLAHNSFISSPYFLYHRVAENESGELIESLLEEIRDEVGFRWIREPKQTLE